MNSKRTWIEKLGDFISGKGFYLVVLICVAAIALSGYYLVRGLQDDTLDQPVSGSAAIYDQPTVNPGPRVTAQPSAAPSAKPSAAPSARPSAAPSAQPSAQPAPTAQPAAESDPVLTAPPAAEPTPAALVFTWPVNGTIIADYSVETLAYSETMGDWRTHDGLDLAVTLGDKVTAAANGTVSAVYQDDFMGTVVEIDHGNGLVSQYASLAEVPTVKVGDAVKTGTVIGSVGATAAAENGRQPHLHFAMYQDGNPVDPHDYLPKQ